jgi:hypothetical protein
MQFRAEDEWSRQRAIRPVCLPEMTIGGSRVDPQDHAAVSDLSSRRSIGGGGVRSQLLRAIALALVMGIGNPGRAAEHRVATPKKIHVGVYVKEVHGISLKDSLVTVDFYVWFRWTDDGLKPLESFDLVNGRIESKQSAYDANIEGVHYASCRVVAALHKLWDVSRYPLDSHTFAIEIEDNNLEAEKLI